MVQVRFLENESHAIPLNWHASTCIFCLSLDPHLGRTGGGGGKMSLKPGILPWRTNASTKKNKSNADAVLMIDSPFTAGGAAVARGLDLGKKNTNH